MTGKSVTCTKSTRPAAISLRFIDRLPCERSGTSDSSLSLATTSTAAPLSMVASGQPRVSCNVEDTTVAGMCIVLTFHSSSEWGSMPDVMICAVSRKVVAPNTIRCSPPFMRPEIAPPAFGGTAIAKALQGCKKELARRDASAQKQLAAAKNTETTEDSDPSQDNVPDNSNSDDGVEQGHGNDDADDG